MAADGTVLIDTSIDADGMQKGFEKIKSGASNVSEQVKEISDNLTAAFGGIDITKPMVKAQMKIDELKQQILSVESALDAAAAAGQTETNNEDVARMVGERERLYEQLSAARQNLAIDAEFAAQREAQASEKAAQREAVAAEKAAQREAAAAEKAAEREIAATKKAEKEKERAEKKRMKESTKGIRHFGSRLKEIVMGAFVFNAISAGLRSVTQYMGTALKSNQAFATSLARVKGSLLTAFQPIYEAVLPALISLMNILNAVIQAIGKFLAALSGKSYSQMQQNAKALNKQAGALGGVGDAAQEAKKQLMGFDEINKLQDTSTSGGGGGGGTGKVSPIFDDASEYDAIESKLGKIIALVSAIAAGLKLWEISGKLPADLGKITTALGGIAFAIAGIILEWDGLKDAWENGVDFGNLAKIVGGGGLLTAGGALIGKAFGSAILGGAIGAIIAGVPAFIAGVRDAILNGLDLLNATLISASAAAVGAGIGAIIGMLGGPIGAGIGALIGLAVGLVTDLVILIVQKWDEICEFFSGVAEWFDTNVIQPVAEFFSGLWSSISQWASDSWESIKEFFSPAIEWFSELFGSVKQTLADIFYNIGVIASGCWEIIKAAWGIVSDWFDQNVIQPVANFFSEMWDSISAWAANAWSDICAVFSVAADWFSRNVIQPVAGFFSKLWSDISQWASGVWEDIQTIFGNVVSFFKGILNGIIGSLNSALGWIFGGINKILDSLKGMSVLGISPFSGLRMISVPQIPYLAQGAVIPPNREFMAVLGDQTSGNNIEAPEALIRKIVREETARGTSNTEIIIILKDILEAILGIEIGDEVIGKAAARYNRTHSRAMGV